MAGRPTIEELRKEAIAAFPFERIETTGEQALATWRQLKAAGRGTPVVLGDDEEVSLLMDTLDPADPLKRTPAEILAAAGGIRHPDGLSARRAQDAARAREYLKQQQLAGLPSPRQLTPDEQRGLQTLFEAATRDLPEAAPGGARGEAAPGLSVASGRITGKPLAKVHITLIPTEDWTTVPAYLNWGGWNACPHPEHHVAALRSWRDRFGAELVGLSHDTMNLTVARRPATPEAALALAREQFTYCEDIVHWGTKTVDQLADTLLTDEWWYFWWD